jgi:tRNA threonylcarbamoyladenosine biosynthesis protein TsaB
MILLLDTSTSLIRIELHDENSLLAAYDWQADRTLAENIYQYLETKLSEQGSSLKQLSGIGLFKGPGSFTGLRIGAAVCNTLSSELQIPLVGEVGEEWKKNALSRLADGETDKIALPYYGRGARITTPRK